MQLAAPSRALFGSTFDQWEVTTEYAGPMFNYLVYALKPGSAFTALLANDAQGFITHSHPANTVAALKALMGWIQEFMPLIAYGSYDRVANWTCLSEQERRYFLEQMGLIYPEKTEVLMLLKQPG